MASQRKRSGSPKPKKARIISEREQSERAATAAMELNEDKQHPSGHEIAHGYMAGAKYMSGWPGVAQSQPLTQGHQQDSPTNQPHPRRSGELADGHPTSPYPYDAGPTSVAYMNAQAPMVPQIAARDMATANPPDGAWGSSIRAHEARATLAAMHQRDAASPYLAEQLGARAPAGSRGVNRPDFGIAPQSPTNRPGTPRDGGGASHIPISDAPLLARPATVVPPPGAQFGGYHPASLTRDQRQGDG